MSTTDGELSLRFFIPLRTSRGQNNREHYMARARRVSRERQTVFSASPRAHLVALNVVASASCGVTPGPVCTVTLTRVSPGRGVDGHDNLAGSLKAVVDELASILGVDDRDPRVTWKYQQERGDWGVWVHIAATLAGPEVMAPKPRPLSKAPERRTTDGIARRLGFRPSATSKSLNLKPAFTPGRSSS